MAMALPNSVLTVAFCARAPVDRFEPGNDASIAGLKPTLPVGPPAPLFTCTSTTCRVRTVGTVTPSETRRVMPISPVTGKVRTSPRARETVWPSDTESGAPAVMAGSALWSGERSGSCATPSASNA
jgi:hypothetical protein